MLGKGGILQKVYQGASLVAVLNVLAVGGLIAALVMSGALDREKMYQLVKVMRDELPAMDPQAAQAATVQPEVATDDELDQPRIRTQEDLEVLRMEAERIQTELEQRVALSNSIMLRVTAEREAFKKERELARERDAEQAAEREAAGFKKQIAIFEAMSPKIAVEHLLSLQDPSEAAQLLLQLETRRAKQIVEMAKDGPELERMKLILRRVSEASPEKSDELEGDQP